MTLTNVIIKNINGESGCISLPIGFIESCDYFKGFRTLNDKPLAVILDDVEGFKKYLQGEDVDVATTLNYLGYKETCYFEIDTDIVHISHDISRNLFRLSPTELCSTDIYGRIHDHPPIKIINMTNKEKILLYAALELELAKGNDLDKFIIYKGGKGIDIVVNGGKLKRIQNFHKLISITINCGFSEFEYTTSQLVNHTNLVTIIAMLLHDILRVMCVLNSHPRLSTLRHAIFDREVSFINKLCDVKLKANVVFTLMPDLKDRLNFILDKVWWPNKHDIDTISSIIHDMNPTLESHIRGYCWSYDRTCFSTQLIMDVFKCKPRNMNNDWSCNSFRFKVLHYNIRKRYTTNFSFI